MIFVLLETERNTLQKRCKIFNFTITVSSHYLMKKTKTTDPYMQSILSNRLFVTFAESCSMFLFSYSFFRLLENSFSSLLAENLVHSQIFFIRILSTKANV